MGEYNKRLTEVDEILKHLSKNELEKIPEEIRTVIKENKDKDYEWEYDETKPLEEQSIKRDTIVILSYLNTEYLLNEEQKKLMEKFYKLNAERLKQNLEQQKGVEDLFKSQLKEQQPTHIINDEEPKALTEVNQSFFSKLLSKIKSIFKAK